MRIVMGKTPRVGWRSRASAYINPRKKDHVYVRKVACVSQYVQKQYLLWILVDVLGIINGNLIAGESKNESFQSVSQQKISFGQLYYFIKSHKQYIFVFVRFVKTLAY